MMIIFTPQAGDCRVTKIFAIWPRKIDERRSAVFQFVFMAEYYLVNSWSSLGYFLTQKEADEAVRKHKEKTNPKKELWHR